MVTLVWNGSEPINQIITHMHDTNIVFEGPGAQRCDVAVWVRFDFYDQHPGEECSSANYFLALDAHSPPDHGGHLDYRPDLGNFSAVVLAGIHDSDDYLDPDPLLEKSGTYALCIATYQPGDYSDCLTWQPHADNFTFYRDVQIHIQHVRDTL